MRVEATLITRPDGVKNGGGELAAWGRLLTKKYRARTMVGVLMMVFQRPLPLIYLMDFLTHGNSEWSGINALLYYGPTLVRSIGLQGDTVSLIVSGGIGIVQFLAVGPAVVWIDQLGKSSTYPSYYHLHSLLIILFREETTAKGYAFRIDSHFMKVTDYPFFTGGSAAMAASHLIIAFLVRSCRSVVIA